MIDSRFIAGDRSIIGGMRVGCVILLSMLMSAGASAAAPTSQPTTHKRPPAMSIQEAEHALGLLGPVRLASYTQTFAAPKVDPHAQFRDRHIYGLPSYSPYLFYGWCYPCYGYGSYGCFGGGAGFISPASAFYGD